MPVSVQIRPDRRIAVDILATLAVAQERALALDEHQRFVIRRAPVGVLGERMPAVRLIGRGEIAGGGKHFRGKGETFNFQRSTFNVQRWARGGL